MPPTEKDDTWEKTLASHFDSFIEIYAAPRAGERESSEGLTDHVDSGSSRPRPMMLLDGVVESGLTQLNSSHTDPEA